MTSASIAGDDPGKGEKARATSPASAAKAEAILIAARNVFLASGYEGASVDLIAAKAGVSKATLYARFGSKEKLFAAMVESFCAAEAKVVEQIEAERRPSADGLYRVALLLLTGWADPDALRFGRMVMGETARFPRLGRVFAESGILYRQHIVAGMLRRLADQGALAIADADLAAELFVATTRGLVQARSLLREGQPPPRAELADLAREIAAVTMAAYAHR